MDYQSTRNAALRLPSARVIAQGISEEGGLFVPVRFPDLSGELAQLSGLSYQDLARRILSLFLTDFSAEEIADCVTAAYAPEKFGGMPAPARLRSLTENGENKHLLELWHGPTCAFKDMALQILPHFLTRAMEKAVPGKEAVILTATSGDTGKAALEGFKDVPGVRILVFYPRDGVSAMQERQMRTQEGRNVCVCAIRGNFDDAQTAVKKIFTDAQYRARLSEEGLLFSSANSINWGRLLPQIVYYFFAYFELVRGGKIALNEPVNICVPTGNFGNILAAYYARRMGLPVKKLICASNANRVLTDFLTTGRYSTHRDFYTTASPSMDILISSNLERLLFHLAGEDSDRLSAWMAALSGSGEYRVEEEILRRAEDLFWAGSADDEAAFACIRQLQREEGCLCDPHTAVGVQVYRQYLAKTGDRETPVVIASTASPYKFSGSVLGALGCPVPEDEFAALEELERVSSLAAPRQIAALRQKELRFSDCVSPQEAGAYVLSRLGLQEG